MLKKLIPFTLAVLLSAPAAAASIPAGSPDAMEFAQQHLAGVYKLQDTYAGGMVIRQGLLRLDFDPNVGLMVAQNGTALSFTLETVDPEDRSMNLLDKNGQLVTFSNVYGSASLTFSDGQSVRMSHVRPMAGQDWDILTKAYLDAGLVVMQGESAPEEPADVRTAAPIKPSFDCAKASTAVEGMICGSAELAELDSRLASAYKTVRDGADDSAAMRAEQVQWIKQVRNACKTMDCLLQGYGERVEDLEQMARYLSKPAEFR